jgi:hypothetical protein
MQVVLMALHTSVLAVYSAERFFESNSLVGIFRSLLTYPTCSADEICLHASDEI